MKYVIKKVVIGFLIGALLMIFSNAVKADSYRKTSLNSITCVTGYNCSSLSANYMYYTFLAKNVISNENLTLGFTPFSLDGYDGFKITTIMSEYNLEYFEIYEEYPSGFVWGSQTNEGYTITYADGTQAHVSGGAEITTWNLSGVDNTGYSVGTYQDTTFAYQLNFTTNGTANNACFMESANGNQITWNCPKTTTATGINVTNLLLNVRYRTDVNMILYINRNDVLLYNSTDTRLITAIENASSDIVSAINSGNQATQNAINANTQATEQQTQTITDSSTTGANADADALKNNSAFNDNSGIQSLITLPLRFVNNLGTACSPINLTIPYMDAQVTIPCMRSVITSKMPALATIITAVVNGFLLYNIFIQIIDMIHGAKNPDDDRLEVVEL